MQAQGIKKPLMPTRPATAICCGRPTMTRQERVNHFRHCRHPECIARLALYDQIKQYVAQHLK